MKFYKDENFWIVILGIPIAIWLAIWITDHFDIFKFISEITP